MAEKLPNSTTVGTITATFAAAWPQDGFPPEDEASSRKDGDSRNATGKGPSIGTSFTEVVRSIGRLRVSVSVRYAKNDPAP